jgi:hypothetical protein
MRRESWTRLELKRRGEVTLREINRRSISAYVGSGLEGPISFWRGSVRRHGEL